MCVCVGLFDCVCLTVCVCLCDSVCVSVSHLGVYHMQGRLCVMRNNLKKAESLCPRIFEI